MAKEDNTKIIESYDVICGKFKAIVNIIRAKNAIPTYNLNFLSVSVATRSLLDEVKNEMITEVHISSAEILDPKIIESLKTRFAKKAETLIEQKLPHAKTETVSYLVELLVNEMLGLGQIEFLLQDPNLEEVIINSVKEPVRVYHKKHGWLETNISVNSEAEVQNYSNIIARRVGRQISTLSPLLDAHLISGDRANAVLYPVSNKGNTITIRKFARDPWTVTDLITNKTCSSEIFALIWLAMQYEMNILISGGTGSGKTSILGVVAPFIPLNHRIVSIEDTRELQLPKFLYWCPLTTRQPNQEGKGEVTMLDLLINALRMRPDRIILGEIRKARDAEVLFEAMHTGHSVYSTVHADSINETIERLTNPPISVPPNLLGAVDLNIVMFRDRKTGIRRVYQVGELLSGEDNTSGKQSVKSNILYRWNQGNDKIVKHQDSQKLFEHLSRHTGMSQGEIDQELVKRQKILDFMVKNKIRSLEQVGLVMRMFYVDPEGLVKSIQNNSLKSLLEES